MTPIIYILLFSILLLTASIFFIAFLIDVIDEKNIQIKGFEKNRCSPECFRCAGLGVSLPYTVYFQLSWELKRLGSTLNITPTASKSNPGSQKTVQNVSEADV